MKFVLCLLLASLAATPSNASSFSDRLTNELYSGNDNECSSSTGISMAMSLVYPAATSDAKTELQQVFGFDSQTELHWQDTTNNLTSRMTGECYNRVGTGECFGTNPRLEIANRFYVDDEVTLNASYAELLGEEMIQQIDLAGPNAAMTINGWVNESTNGLIDSIVEPGQTDEWVAVAINSIYLKATWANQFDVENTNSDLFLSPPTSQPTRAHFMNQKEYFPYSHEIPELPGYQVLQHSFTGDYDTGANELSMILVLPPPDDTTAMANSETILNAIPRLERTQVALALPKFRFESTYQESLKQALQSMGVQAVFDDQRLDNLCIQDDACNHYIDTILQKTFIEVNEFGLEAAAVTAVGLGVTSLPPPQATLFLANRPFQFFVHDGLTDTILFEGYVVNPGIIEGSVAPLEGSHNDDDFWKTNFGITVSRPEFDNGEGTPQGVSGNNNGNNNNDTTVETPDNANTEPETSVGSPTNTDGSNGNTDPTHGNTDPTNAEGGTPTDESSTEAPSTNDSGSQDPDSSVQDEPSSAAAKLTTGFVAVLAMVGLWI